MDDRPLDAELHMKHLEFIQAAILRMSTNSFLLKGWSITLAAALVGFGVNAMSAALALVAVLPVVMLCGLDAYFLQQERIFRGAYEAVRRGDESVEPFEIRPATAVDTASSWFKTLAAPAVIVVHATLIAAVCLAAVLLAISG
jgi:hypothetical protein